MGEKAIILVAIFVLCTSLHLIHTSKLDEKGRTK